MSRRYSIGFLVGIILIIVLFVIIYEFSYQKALDENEKIKSERMVDSNYYVKERDGYVVVYEGDGTVYEYTSILSSELPGAVRREMETGIKLETLTEVYGFLENYSS